MLFIICRNYLTFFSLVVLGFYPVVSNAGADRGLYDPRAPENAAFIRFINLSQDLITPSVDNKDYPVLQPDAVSPFYVLQEGSIQIMSQKELIAESKSFYTVILNEEINIIEDIASSNVTKAIISFYNLGGGTEPLTLRAKEGSVTVLEDVTPGGMKAREINGVKIDLSVYEADKKILDLPETVLERQNHYAVIYDGEGARIVQASVDTTK